MEKQEMERLRKQLTGKYVVTNGLFWMAYVCIWGFGAVYLKGKGFTSTGTGIITALGGLLSVVLQPRLAVKMEKGGRLSVRQAFLLCLGLAVVCGVFLLVCPLSAAGVIACLFLAVMALFQMNSAVLNSLGMEYVNLGIPVNYGLARGAGSVCFALLSLSLGFVTERFGVDALIVLCLAFSLCLIGVLATYQSTKALKEQYPDCLEMAPTVSSAGQKGGMWGMFREDPGLAVLLLGFMFIFIGHFMNNTYMIDLVGRFGGGDAQMGIATAFAASLELPAMILVNVLVRRISAARVLQISAASYVLKTVILLGAVNMPLLLLSQLCQFGAYAFFVPASVYYINERVSDRYKVTGQSALGMATMGLGGAVGNFLGGRVQDLAGVWGMVVVCVACTLVGAALTFLALQTKFGKTEKSD